MIKYSISSLFIPSLVNNIYLTLLITILEDYRKISFYVLGTGVTVNALHPGIVMTELGRHMSAHKSALSSQNILRKNTFLGLMVAFKENGV
jgi:hypothetical protein